MSRPWKDQQALRRSGGKERCPFPVGDQGERQQARTWHVGGAQLLPGGQCGGVWGPERSGKVRNVWLSWSAGDPGDL